MFVLSSALKEYLEAINIKCLFFKDDKGARQAVKLIMDIVSVRLTFWPERGESSCNI